MHAARAQEVIRTQQNTAAASQFNLRFSHIVRHQQSPSKAITSAFVQHSHTCGVGCAWNVHFHTKTAAFEFCHSSTPTWKMDAITSLILTFMCMEIENDNFKVRCFCKSLNFIRDKEMQLINL
jgi:hypothetical protein